MNSKRKEVLNPTYYSIKIKTLELKVSLNSCGQDFGIKDCLRD